jgi:hypothetical protein
MGAAHIAHLLGLDVLLRSSWGRHHWQPELVPRRGAVAAGILDAQKAMGVNRVPA